MQRKNTLPEFVVDPQRHGQIEFVVRLIIQFENKHCLTKPGRYILGSSGNATVLRVMATAGGPTRIASLGGTKMLRRTPNGLQKLPVSHKKILRSGHQMSRSSQATSSSFPTAA